MKHSLIIPITLSALPALLGACATAPAPETDYTQFVDPMIGTGDHGHVFLGANVPFGMVQLGPSQTVKGWDWCSGYHYSDSTLLGFSHTHLSGTGIGDLGDILMLPTINADDAMAEFSHTDEICRPGYYSVKLKNSDITAELTATPRTGYQRYSYPTDADTVYVRLNLGYGIGWDKPSKSEIKLVNDSTIEGYRYSTGWAKDQRIYFTARFSQPIMHAALNNDSTKAYAVLSFRNNHEPLLVKTGISPVSIENAEKNLVAEVGNLAFDAAAENARLAWNEKLGKVRIETSKEHDKRKFYTALYHTMFAPAVFSDTNGDYRGADGNIHNTDGKFENYTIFSLWDTYRAAHPLSTLIHPELQTDYANTFINIYRQQGKLPVWHLHGNETDCMIGNPGVIVLGDLLAKGFVDDSIGAYDAMKASCMLDERSLGALKTYGYIPYDAPDCNESVAKGMEYAIADAAVAKAAALTGNQEDHAIFSERAKAYKHYFDSSTGFMRGKSTDGAFRNETFNPFATTHRADDYCEGNGWQYVWLVPHDPHGLIGLFGSDEAFTCKLDSLFTVESNLGEGASPDISGLIGQYAHGNEPSHHTIYLYNYAGQPYKAAPLLRKVMNELYKDEPAGLCGNEDVGQMSAWFVLSSMGIYQVEPTGGKFVFGSPLFDSATINVGDGRTFEIRTINNSDDNIYIQSARLNGRPYEKSYIDFALIKAGGLLEFEMGPVPSKTFGIEPDARP